MQLRQSGRRRAERTSPLSQNGELRQEWVRYPENRLHLVTICDGRLVGSRALCGLSADRRGGWQQVMAGVVVVRQACKTCRRLVSVRKVAEDSMDREED